MRQEGNAMLPPVPFPTPLPCPWKTTVHSHVSAAVLGQTFVNKASVRRSDSRSPPALHTPSLLANLPSLTLKCVARIRKR